MNEYEDRKPATTSGGDALPPKEIDWSTVYENQLAQDDQSSGGFLNNMLAKIGCGCMLPAVFMLSTCASLATPSNYVGGPPAMMIGQVTGSVIVGIFLVWAPLFIFWLRDQNKWLIGGSFAVFAAVFTLIGIGKIGSAYSALKDDAAAISDVKFDAEGNPILLPGMSAKGPMSKMMVEMVAEQTAIRNDFDAEIRKSGIGDMMLADRVKRNPELVQNCERILALRETIENYRARNLKLVRSTPDRIEALDMSYDTKAEMKRGAIDKMDFNVRTTTKQWDLQAQSLLPIHRTCILLSKRSWKAQGELYLFYNQADITTFDNAMREIDRVNAEIEAVTKERITDVQAGQELLKSRIGSKP